MILGKSPLIPLYESGKYVHFLPFVRGDTEGFIRRLTQCEMSGFMPLVLFPFLSYLIFEREAIDKPINGL
jgi:hypothetical protein